MDKEYLVLGALHGDHPVSQYANDSDVLSRLV